MRALSTIVAFIAVATNSADAAESMSMSAPLFEAEMSIPGMVDIGSMKMRTRNLRTNSLSRRVLEDMSMSMPLFEAEMSMPDEGSMVESATRCERCRRNLRTSFGIRRTQTEDIKCVWDSKFDDAESHTKACKKLHDEHRVAYTCDGQYMKVCCTVSSLEFPVFNIFGKCQKVGSSTTDNGDEGLVLVDNPDMSMPMSMPESPEPTSKPIPESEPEITSDPTTISCTRKKSFDKKHDCERLGTEFSVPYECDGDAGKNVCCTVSIIDKPVFEKFGNCVKKKVGGFRVL